MARSGGARYSPTRSRTCSTKNGSVESLNEPRRWGLSPNVCQIRATAVWDRPSARASDRVLQWVASAGRDSRVRVTAASTCSSVIVRGAPGRGSSASPSNRRSANRSRHLRTVGTVTRRSAAMAALGCPAAAANAMWARRANRWALVGRHAQSVSLARSSSVRVIGVGLGPRGIGNSSGGFPTPIDRPAETGNELVTQDTSSPELLFSVSVCLCGSFLLFRLLVEQVGHQVREVGGGDHLAEVCRHRREVRLPLLLDVLERHPELLPLIVGHHHHLALDPQLQAGLGG